MCELHFDTSSAGDCSRELAEVGFSTIPKLFTEHRLFELVEAYDRVMSQELQPNFRVGSTTNRMSDLLSCSRSFDQVFTCEPLLEVCKRFIGQAFQLSSLLGRTLRAGSIAQALHADLPRNSLDAPVLGFIVMIDSFSQTNGATRFVPGSQRFPHLPDEVMVQPRSQHPDERLVCGEAGNVVVFDSAVWHGHTANRTSYPRRSIQGYFIRRDATPWFNFCACLPEAVKAQMTPLVRHLLALQEQ